MFTHLNVSTPMSPTTKSWKLLSFIIEIVGGGLPILKTTTIKYSTYMQQRKQQRFACSTQ